MKPETKKLRGTSLKTMIGEITLKEYYRIDNCQYDQIYFKTIGIDGIAKLYDLEQPASVQRFHNEMQQYSNRPINMIYDRVHCEQVKIKKIDYGLVLFQRLDKDPTLQDYMNNLSNYQKIQLALTLFELLQELKEQRKIYCNIRPSNIYKSNGKFVLINSEYLRNEGTRNDMDSFMLQTIENNWQYWPSEFTDPYSNEPFDFALDVYAVGCILYELVTGKYPFDSKLSASNNQYTRLDRRDLLSSLAQSCIGSATSRRNLNFKQIITKLKESNQDIKAHNEFSEAQEQKNFRKGSGNGILENISNVFSKMMYDSEGWFLSYVQDDQKAPVDKYLDNILTKMYKKQEKADKLSTIMQKFVSSNSSKIRSIKKTLLLIGQIFRKGPQAALTSLTPNINSIKTKFNTDPQIESFCNILLKKLQINQRLKGIISGNFYLSEMSNFKRISIQDISAMVIYLQQLIYYVSNRIHMDNTQLSTCLINFVCDQIYDLISMVIFSIISIRKDNQLQLRHDKLSELPPIEKNLNVSLKKLSQISNYISAHAIYSLEGQYIPYQEEIMLRSNPYYSTLEYFYYNCRNYKGLSIPNDYSIIFNPNIKQEKEKEKKNALSASKQVKNTSFNGKSYFKQEINSDDEEDYSKASPELIHKVSQGHSKDLSKKVIPTPKIIQKKTVGQGNHLKKSLDQEIFSKNSSQENSHKNNKNQGTISFEEFGNIYKIQKEISPPKKFDDFFFFNQVKKDAQKKPPLPVKRESTKQTKDAQKSKQNQKETNKNFVQFDKIFDKNITRPKNVTVSQNKQSKPSLNPFDFDAFNPFVHHPPPIIQPKQLAVVEIVNPLVTKILQGLKLKQLKDLILRNEKIVIQFSQLKIIKAIGSGSAGEVFYGKYKDQDVAIKRVKAKQNPNALKEFERELVTYIKIKSNPNLVSLTGISESNGDFYLITQFCSGGSLFDILHKKKLEIVLNWRERLNFAIEIAQGMQFLHSMKPIIIHRDLKSLNVFVTKNEKNEWKMKVADFGLSRTPQAEMMTTQLGTIHWMAPQLLQGKQYSFKVDVYSYGILLWQILSRTTPYSNLHNPMAILKYVVMDRKRPNLQFIPKQCPTQLLSVMEKCWAHEPNDRPTFSQVIKLLKMINL